VTSGALHGHQALRDYLDRLAAMGALLDAHPYSFEVLGDCVIVSGALRVRRRGRRRRVGAALVGVSRGRRPGRLGREPPPAATMRASMRARSISTSARPAAEATRR
jgi:hypothetical protein